MQWNSGPESPREKWEYRRAQKEWDKLRQKESGANHYQYPYAPPRKKPMVRPGFLIALAAVLALAWYLQTDAGQQRFVGFLNTLSQEQQAPLPQISTDFAPITGGTDTTKLSMQTGHYVDVQKAVVEQLGAIEKSMYVDLQDYGSIQYRYYEDSIADLLAKIDALRQTHIASTSPMAEFESYCSGYYGAIETFFVGLQQKQSIENADYNALVTWQQENESPFDKLCQLMDDNGVAYNWQTNEDGEEYIHFLMSDNGAY